MNLEIITALLAFAGGLGLFLYGMEIMAEGLQQAAGEKTRKLLEALTTNPFMGLCAGAMVTSIIQSSSAVTVMVVGFVNSGLMSLKQAAGVIMGANIGTTMTSWIVSMGEWAAFLKPEMIAPVLLLIGVGIHMFSKNGRIRDVAKVLIGFGILFTGLSSMSTSVKPFVDLPIFSQIFTTLGSNPILGILAGVFVTAIIQSSSASMGILQTLAMAGAVNWGSAVFIALGQNIGTCVTALLSAISGDTNAKRAAMIHLEFNVIGAVIVGIVAWVFFLFNPGMMLAQVTSSGLAIFHTSFNLAVTILLFPFMNALVSLSCVLVPAHGSKQKMNTLVLDPRFLSLPKAAIAALFRELDQIKTDCSKLIGLSRNCLIDQQGFGDLEKDGEQVLKACLEVREYCSKIDVSEMNLEEQKEIQTALFMARDLHRIAAQSMKAGLLNQETMTFATLDDSVCETINSVTTLFETMLDEIPAGSDHLSPSLIERIRTQSLQSEHMLDEVQKEQMKRKNQNVQTSWMLFEVCDAYSSIASRCLRLADEETWQNHRIQNPPAALELSAS